MCVCLMCRGRGARVRTAAWPALKLTSLRKANSAIPVFNTGGARALCVRHAARAAVRRAAVGLEAASGAACTRRPSTSGAPRAVCTSTMTTLRQWPPEHMASRCSELWTEKLYRYVDKYKIINK